MSVAQTAHQLGPGARDALRIPTLLLRLAGKAETRHRRYHELESIRRACAMSGGIGERIDDLQLLDDRSGPAMGHDERQGVFVARTDMDEMDVNSVDLGHEHGQRVEACFHLAPVITGAPIADDVLERGKLV